MNYREQLEAKIEQLDEAIEVLGNLPTHVEGVQYLDLLQRKRKQHASELLAEIVTERNPLQIKLPE